ncbi:hypothetical protein [Octadecabacter sp. R77987]|uniref:hypothetical protein n=1 Tax=Octadecabacter sp. R77987 TaxID=3093874 RepID=UPI00366F0E22
MTFGNYVFAAILIGLPLIMAYSLLFGGPLGAAATRSTSTGPISMEDEAGLSKFHFSENGFRYDGSRSDILAGNLTRKRIQYNSSTDTYVQKTLVMGDRLTGMLFLVTLERINSLSVTTHKPSRVIKARPIYNRPDLFDVLSQLNRMEKLEEIESKNPVFPDAVARDQDLMLASHGSNAETSQPDIRG